MPEENNDEKSFGIGAALLLLGNVASADLVWIPQPEVNWTFGQYGTCLGGWAIVDYQDPAYSYAKDQLDEHRKSDRREWDHNYWGDAILNEQVLHATETALEQCKLRAAGEDYSSECPLGSLSVEEATQKVGADNPEFWQQDYQFLKDLKAEQKDQFNALKPLLEEACGK